MRAVSHLETQACCWQKNAASTFGDAAFVNVLRADYQTWQALSLTIFCPGLQWKALAKSGLLRSGPITRY